MGKASRTKRERRINPPTPTPDPTRRTLPVFWIALVGIVLAGLATLIITAPNDQDRAVDAKAAKVPAFADVATTGDSLPTWTGSTRDAAEGEVVPELRGTGIDGMRMNLAPGDGTARVYVVVAHWCPHCQDEVPRLVEWARDNPAVDGVEIVAISTAVSESQDNFPPAAWLAREKWPYDVMIDDEVGTAAEALGVEGFPFIVFADQSGKVVRRFSGEMPISEFNTGITDLAGSSDAAR